MIKNILYAIATILLLLSCYFIYDWYKSEPENKEPLPALISAIATLVMAIIAWRSESASKDGGVSITGDNNNVNQGISNSNIQIHSGIGGDENKSV